jgi:hypothetical protein
VIDIVQALSLHCADAEALAVKVRPGRYKVTIADKTRTVLVYRRSRRYQADFVRWLKRVCC